VISNMPHQDAVGNMLKIKQRQPSFKRFYSLNLESVRVCLYTANCLRTLYNTYTN